MNNSKIAYGTYDLEENKDNRLSFLQKQEGELAQVVEAINRVEASEDWQKLKKLLLDGVVTTLEKQLLAEANRKEIDSPEIYKLQGQLAWAKKYADLKKLSDIYRQQVENLKNQIKYEQNPRDEAL